ncbi:MAG: hypothetical protein ACFCVA_06410 [Gammaproteobacteria bacterium]
MTSKEPETHQQVGLTATHGLLEVENRLRGGAGQAGDPLGDEVLHPLGKMGFLEKARAIPLGRNQLIELFDLVAELNGQRIRLKLAGIADGLHRGVPRIGGVARLA